MNLDPEIERKSPAEIKSFQETRLKSTLQYVAQNSPFYKNHFEVHAIDVGKIEKLEDLQKIPPTTKEDLQNRNWEFLCIPRERIFEYTSTSGTLGKPVTIALSHSDLERLAYNEAISFICADGKPGDIYQLMLTLDRQFMAGIAYYQGIRKMGASVVRVGPGVPAMQWDSIQRIKPTTLVAVPSFLIKLIEHAQSHNIDLNNSSVTSAVCIGESLRSEDFEFSVIGKRIRDNWNIKLYGTYASTEMQTAFTECHAGLGGHHHPELLIVELLDESNRPVRDGERGEIVITTLGVEGMPLIRYKTGDIATAHRDSCSCGRNTMRLGPIVGRKQHQIKLKGTTIYPPAVFELLNDMEFIQDYVVEVFSGHLGTDDLRIHVVVKGEIKDSMVQHLNSIFQSRLRVLPQIDFTSPGQLEKMQLGKGERKIRRFIDSRQVN